jgi:hypothetical protein
MSKLTNALSNILDWAKARNLINGSDSKSQSLKLFSEFGESGLAIAQGAHVCASDGDDAALEKAHSDLIDGIGDTVVVLTIIAEQEGYLLADLIQEYAPLPRIHGYEFYQASSTIGKLADSVLKRDNKSVGPYLAYTFHHLADMADYFQYDITNCVEVAYDEIKDCKGVMYNGAFIKSTDDRYQSICEELGLQA